MEKLNPGDFRLTIRTLQSGQAGAYTDTVGVYRIYIEWIPWNKLLPLQWTPWDCDDLTMVKQWVKGIHGWSREKSDPKPANINIISWHFMTILDYFRKVGVAEWEWCVREPFTD